MATTGTTEATASKEELKEMIHKALKSGDAILGYNKSLEFMKNGSPKLAVVANNAPDDRMKELAHNAKVASIKMEVFDGDSKELGVVCGKPFPILVLVIKK